MRAAIRRGNGVAVKAGRSLAIKGPGERPVDRALHIGKILTTGDALRRHAFPRPDLFLQMILTAAGNLDAGPYVRVVSTHFRSDSTPVLSPPQHIGIPPRK